MDLSPGQEVGQYRIVQKIGEGGMGAVYKADQPSIARFVVIKVLASSLADHPEARDRFRRELDMITRLEHPHILPVYDYGEVNGSPFIVMRYMTGGSLQERLQAKGFGRAEALHLLDQVALALDFAHDRGIIHRDLKPGNILLDEMGNAYLADFGLAKTISGTQDLTATGGVLGSPAYMSPEQARGGKLDRRSDIYSFAGLIYQALSGRLPFEADTAWGYITKHITEEPVPIRRYAPDLPPAVEDVLRTGLAKDREARPERATELMASLKKALAAVPGSSPTLIESAPGRVVSTSTAARRGPIPSPSGVAVAVPRPAAPAWRLPVLVAAGAAALLVGGAVMAGVLFLGGTSLMRSKPSTYAVGDEPRALLFDGDALWVANFFDSTLTKLSVSACGSSEEECGQSLGTFPVDQLPVALAFDGNDVWVASAGDQTLLVLDRASGEILGRHQVLHVPTALLWAESSLWIANDIGGTVTRLSTEGQVQADIDVGQGPVSLAFDEKDVWVASKGERTLVRMDAASDQVKDRLPVEGEPTALAFDGKWLWVGLGGSGQILQIDPATLAVLAQVEVGSPLVALHFDGAQLWAAAPDAGKVFRIDPIEAKVVGQISVAGYPVALQSTTCGGGCRDLWTANQDEDSVSRISIK